MIAWLLIEQDFKMLSRIERTTDLTEFLFLFSMATWCIEGMTRYGLWCQARLESERKVTGSHLWRFEMRAVILDGEGCGDFGVWMNRKEEHEEEATSAKFASAVDDDDDDDDDDDGGGSWPSIARDRSYDEILVTEKLNAAAVLACFFSLYSINETLILS